LQRRLVICGIVHPSLDIGGSIIEIVHRFEPLLRIGLLCAIDQPANFPLVCLLALVRLSSTDWRIDKPVGQGIDL